MKDLRRSRWIRMGIGIALLSNVGIAGKVVVYDFSKSDNDLYRKLINHEPVKVNVLNRVKKLDIGQILRIKDDISRMWDSDEIEEWENGNKSNRPVVMSGGMPKELPEGMSRKIAEIRLNTMNDDNYIVEEYGADIAKNFAIPYTTSRVDMYDGMRINKNANMSSRYPYSATGKLLFKEGKDTYMCTASMIARGVLVTAAHCVQDYGKGKRGVHKNFIYIPALKKRHAPLGIWKGAKALVLNSYVRGKKGECLSAKSGTVCANDVAVIILQSQKGRFAGDYSGWYRIGANYYSFAHKSMGQITALGYPGSHDQGLMMQRNDSTGYRLDKKHFNSNIIIGSRMTGGSSGGPWLVNFGEVAKLGLGVKVGKQAVNDVVIGVTSWGFANDKMKVQFSSPFTTKNIIPLFKTACKINRKACR